ncbi:MAG: 4-hydroxythreonine-4-phosphate dehydrogenase PdxA [Hyphomicrobiales bacterium]|nr:4-hydroxythreonine-4-phosphate dehydrogenase PdxA [Hyphomicrobiales bacterium]
MAPRPVLNGKPVIALAMGDPSGISSELLAKVLDDPQVRAAVNLLVVGDVRALDEGARIARTSTRLTAWIRGSARPDFANGPVLLDSGSLDPATLTTGTSSRAGGAFSMQNFRTVLSLAAEGLADAVSFTPFNKHAMRLAEPSYVDEVDVIATGLGEPPGREFNVLPTIWNARVTSHVPLSGVAPLIRREAVREAIVLTDRCMRAAGFAAPRIAVAALNPHAGDGGNFGHEDDDEIAPAVTDAQTLGIQCEGPFPSDTVFLRAKRGDFDAVQTMYHDQGQIAMKLLGFEDGVTLIGGHRVPVTTPAHGTAYDIAGKGVAHPGATRAALLLAAKLALASGRTQEVA